MRTLTAPNDFLQAIADCRRFIGPSQISVMLAAARGEEGAWFRQKFADLAQQFATMPKTYETEGQGGPVVHLHYFVGSADFYILERDVEPVQLQAYGHADLFGDGGELGYISIVEITRAGAELDLHWAPAALSDVLKKKAARRTP